MLSLVLAASNGHSPAPVAARDICFEDVALEVVLHRWLMPHVVDTVDGDCGPIPGQVSGDCEPLAISFGQSRFGVVACALIRLFAGRLLALVPKFGFR